MELLACSSNSPEGAIPPTAAVVQLVYTVNFVALAVGYGNFLYLLISEKNKKESENILLRPVRQVDAVGVGGSLLALACVKYCLGAW